jgi:radical SAM superfamily enzyme YgiQ (UPF0313 family)
MRVLLIVPTFRYKYTYPFFLTVSDFPVGFAYLASALSNAGQQVHGLNLNNDSSYGAAYEMIYDKISRSLQEIKPELICLGGLCTDFKFLNDAIQIIRKLAPDVPIVCGGGIVNNDPEFVFRALHPDFCIIGEGEEILVQLASMLESNSREYEQISNLGYWNNGAARFTKQDFNYIDINFRHFPDYEPFGINEMLDNYSMAARYLYRYSRLNPRPMPIVTARGCPFNCTFCVHQKGPRYRARSLENIMQEIEFLYERYHFNILIILDELFAVNKQKMNDFSNSILEARRTKGWDFDWAFQTHASASLDRETLENAKKAGCYFFSYGLESASPMVLASMNKRTKPAQIIQAIEMANSTRVGFGGNFIFGDVAETPETIRETFNFFSKYCDGLHTYFAYIQPYPGSKLFDDCIKKGIITDKLEFYKHIDEHAWNMTAMPDKLWLPWILLLSFLVKPVPWVKTATASSVIESETASNPMEIESGRSFCTVKATCPYCGEDIYYKELLGKNIKREDQTSQKKRFILSKPTIRNEIFIVRLKLCLRNAYLYILNFRQPIFKLLKDTIVDRGVGGLSFVTGCTHCNKLIRVRISVKEGRYQVKSLLRKILLKGIWLFQ